MIKPALAVLAIATVTCGPAAPLVQPAAPVAQAPRPVVVAPSPVIVAPVPKAIAQPALIAQPLPGDATRTTIHRLSNGMTVYLSPDPQEPSVVAHIAVHAGSSFDPGRWRSPSGSVPAPGIVETGRLVGIPSPPVLSGDYRLPGIQPAGSTNHAGRASCLCANVPRLVSEAACGDRRCRRGNGAAD